MTLCTVLVYIVNSISHFFTRWENFSIKPRDEMAERERDDKQIREREWSF